MSGHLLTTWTCPSVRDYDGRLIPCGTVNLEAQSFCACCSAKRPKKSNWRDASEAWERQRPFPVHRPLSLEEHLRRQLARGETHPPVTLWQHEDLLLLQLPTSDDDPSVFFAVEENTVRAIQ